MDVNIVIFDPHYLIFAFGIAIHRYEEYTEDFSQFRVRRELEIGMIFLSVRFNWYFPQELPEEITNT